MWPAPSHSSRLEPGMRECSLRLWPTAGDLVVGAADDRGRDLAEDLDVVEVVERRERRVEVGDHGERASR